jgi:hypothetical protein
VSTAKKKVPRAPAAKKKIPRAPAPRAATKSLEHYLGCFVFDELSDRDSNGSFQIIVQALGPEDAADRCHALLEKLRSQTTLFARPCSIYIDGIIRLRGSFEDGLLVNYSSTISSGGPRGSIGCLIPEQEHDAEGYDWTPEPKGKKKKKKGGEEGVVIEPFIDFGGQAIAEQRAAEDESRAKTAKARHH